LFAEPGAIARSEVGTTVLVMSPEPDIDAVRKSVPDVKVSCGSGAVRVRTAGEFSAQLGKSNASSLTGRGCA